MFERLTPEHGWKDASYDTWEICGLDHACKRDCWKPIRCEIPKMLYRLAAYEDSGLSPEEVQELAKAKADGRGKVVHGKWISEEICSACNFDICDMLSGDLEGVRFETPDYCPNCGTKMDGEAAEKAIAVIGGGMNG